MKEKLDEQNSHQYQNPHLQPCKHCQHRQILKVLSQPINILYIVIFSVAFLLSLVIIVAKVIIVKKEIKIEKSFIVDFIIIFATITCAGGALGSYGQVKGIKELELIQMRTCTGIFMFLISAIVLPFFMINNFRFIHSFNESQQFCLDYGKPKGHQYLEAKKQREELFPLKEKYEYLYKNDLTCVEKEKCLRLSKDLNSFLCNYNANENEKNNQNNLKCIKIYETQDIIGKYNNNDLDIFVNSCVHLAEEKNKDNKDKNYYNLDYNLYKCDSENIDLSNKQKTKEDEDNIENYHNEKMSVLGNKIIQIDQVIDSYISIMNSYDLVCFTTGKRFLYYMMIYLYVFSYFGICCSWFFIGGLNILKTGGWIKDQEMIDYKNRINMKIFENSMKGKQFVSDESIPLKKL